MTKSFQAKLRTSTQTF